MATLTPLEDRLQMRYEDGERYRVRSWGNVKPGTADAVLLDFAEALGDLSDDTVDKWLRVKIGQLEE